MGMTHRVSGRTNLFAALVFGLLTATARAAAPTISIQGAPALGSATAKVVVVEFSDFQCPYCGKFARQTFETIQERYIAPGTIRYVFRHFPLDEAHPKAFRAAEAAECANQQGKFWEMHARLFANQQSLDPPDLLTHASALGLDAAAFQKCFGGAAKGKVKRDFNDGVKAGVGGAPTLLIGKAGTGGKNPHVKKPRGPTKTQT